MKKITQKNKQENSLDYLRDQAITAHLNGDGVLVNHLCSIAISYINKWRNENKLEVSIISFRWSLILALYWLADDYMLNAVDKCIRNYKKKHKSEDNLLSCLNSLTNLVEHSLSDCEKEINKLKDNNIDWTIDFQPEDELFLTYCIELVFVRKPEDHVWNELANIWIQKQPNYSKSLNALQARLVYQANSLYPKANYPSIDFPKDANKDLFDAWEARLNCNWDNLDKLLDKLFYNLTLDSSEAVSDWHLHHMAHISRKRDPEIIGLTRRQLIISGHYGAKQHQINDIRDHNFYKKLSKLLEINVSTYTANQSASKRFSCFRLSLLNELFALREWDLMSCIISNHQKAQVYLVLIQNPNLEDNYRVTFSISAFNLLALSASLSDKEYLHKKITLNIDKTSKEQREEIITKLINLRQLMWRNVISAFLLLSDAIPKHSLYSVAEWCVKYNKHDTNIESGWRTDWLTFWGDILGYYSEIDHIFDILHPVILKAAGYHRIWHSDDRHVFKQYIINAPLKKAFEVIDKMFDADVSNDLTFNTIRWSIVYDAARKRKEIADKYNNKLIDTATSPVLKLYSNYICIENEFKPLNDPDKRAWICNDILTQTNNILERNGKSVGFGGGVHPEVLSLVTWPNIEKKLIEALIKTLNYEYIIEAEIGKYFAYLRKLISIGPKGNIDLIRGDFLKWLKKLPKGRDPFDEQFRGPLSGFQVTAPDEKYVFSAFSSMVLEMVKHDTENSAPLVVQWLKDNYSDSPGDSRGILFCLVVSLSVNSDFLADVDMAIIAQELIHKSLWESVQEYNDRPSAAKLIDHIAYLLDLKNDVLTSLSKPINKKRRDMLLNMIERSIDRFAEHVNPNVRAGAAKLLSNWKIASKDTFSNKCLTSLNKLKDDARARVRYSAGINN